MLTYTNAEYIKKMTLTAHSAHNKKTNVVFADNDTLIAAGTYLGIAWNVKTGTQLWKQEFPYGCYNIASASYSDVFAYSDGNYNLNICEANTGKVYQVFERDEERSVRKIIDLAFEPNSNNNIFAIGNGDGTITFMDAYGVYTPFTTSSHGEVTSLAWSPYGKIIAFANDMGTVIVFNLYTRVYLNTFETIRYSSRIRYWMGSRSSIPDRISTIAFNGPGHLAIGTYGGNITIWQSIWDPFIAKTGKLCTLLGHTREIVSLAWANGTVLASAERYNGNIRLWDANKGENFAILQGQTSIDSLSFSPDGRTLASGGNSGIVTIWERTD